MEELKPIKRSKAFVRFSKDHHFGLLLVWQIRRDTAGALETRQIANYVLDFFENDLLQHFKEEEELIFCKLTPEDNLRKQAEAEHSELYRLIECIREDTSNRQILQQFAGTLEAHIRFEERVLFNHLQRMMNPRDIDDLILHAGAEQNNGKLRARFATHHV